MILKLFGFISFLIFFPFLSSAESLPNQTADIPFQIVTGDIKDAHLLKQVGAFKLQKNADQVAQELKQQGKESLVLAGVTKDNLAIYRVYVREQRHVAPEDKSMERVKENIPPEQTPRDSLAQNAPQTPLQESLLADQENLLVLVRNFDNKAYGEQFAHNMEKAGYTARMKDIPSANGESTYVVFAEKPQREANNAVVSREQEIPSHPVITAQISPSVSSPDIKPATTEGTASGRLSAETSSDRVSGSVFGKRGGFVHPFLSITEYYTDNVFFSPDNTKDDFITVFSPGIWLALPHVYEKLLRIETSDVDPGGFSLSRYKPDEFQPYQAYLFYNADIEKFAKHSSEDAVNHKFEGFFQYNLRGGLSFEVMDQYIDSHDDRGTGINTELSEYKTNLANFIMMYRTASRFDFRIDTSYFLVNYDKSIDDYRDRYDLSLAAYIFYKATPKTRFFFEYEYLDITYDENILSDSREHHFFGGMQWDITAKSKGSVKAGYGKKDFASAEENADDFIFEVQIDHHLTPKTSLMLRASRSTNETDVSTTDYVLSDTIELEYLQKITAKISADIKLSYTRDAYKDDFTYNGRTAKLDDDYYDGAFALQYKFREWLQADAGYIFMKRDSSFSEFDYTTNVFFFRLTGSL
jgi:polysaccharide biosynthesis protein VpsM